MNVTATQGATSLAAQPAASPRGREAGKALPPAGNRMPAESRTQPPSISVEKALEQIKSYLQDSQRQLNFQRDESTGRTVIRVIDPNSGEVIRQMPSEEVLKLAAIIDTQGFRTLNELA
jgi:flagellar protein FlaG